MTDPGAPTPARRGACAAAAALLLALLGPAPAAACSVCACGDPLVSAAEGPGRGGDLRLALEAEYLTQHAGSEGDPASTDLLDQYTLRLTAVYSPVDPLNLVLSIPLVRKKLWTEPSAGPAVPTSDLTGLGDVEVGARLFVLDAVDFAAQRRQGVAVSAGTSIPTGPDDARDASGQLVDQHGQLGTGAWGPYAGVSYRFRQDPWSALLSISGRLRTENAHGYRYGNALLWTAQAQWSPLAWLALGLGVDGRDAAQDQEHGAPVENTGGLVLAATPSAYVELFQGLWLTVRAQLPFLTHLVGDQWVGPTVSAGLAYQVL
jgi:hypothetical protein